MTSNGDFDEEAAIGSFWTDTIYTHDFNDGSGKYLNIVTEENGNTTAEYHPPYPSRNRIKLAVTFLRAGGDIKEVTLKKSSGRMANSRGRQRSGLSSSGRLNYSGGTLGTSKFSPMTSFMNGPSSLSGTVNRPVGRRIRTRKPKFRGHEAVLD